jgi:hypothetical protein
MRFLLLLLAPLAACGRDEPPPAAPEQASSAKPAPAPLPAAPSPRETARAASARDAAAVLRRYYDHIEAGRYDEAWAMRGGGGGRPEKQAFARNFAAYERYRVTLGPASIPVEAGGWAYVEVPIQIYGRLKGGEAFGSGGTVSMRRAAGVAGATDADREWHIYTGG